MSKLYLIPSLLGLALVCRADHCDASHNKGSDIVTTAVKAGQFNTLATALTKAGLVDALKGDGPFTVFAPTDAAFAKLPAGTVETLLEPENLETLKGILLYHVVAGQNEAASVVKMNGATTLNGQRLKIAATTGGVTIDGAKVTATDIRCSNGVIHVIDRVLLPESKNLVEVAAGAGQFKTLLAAATAAGLAPTLSKEGPFTVFAPTDAAFAKLPAGTVESLLQPENREKLVAILTYHVVPGRVYAADALAAGQAATVQKGTLRITVKDGKAKVQNAAIVATDINAGNGVIHVIDTVLLPSGEG